MLLVMTHPPQTEPVALERLYLQLNLRPDGSPPVHRDDALLEGYRLAARVLIEARTSKCLIEQQWRIVLPEQCYQIRLPIGPVQEVVDAWYEDSAGVDARLDTSEYYLGNEAMPLVHATRAMKMVDFRVGYGPDPDDVPEVARLAIQMLTAFWYANREHVIVGTISASLPDTVTALLNTIKTIR